MKIDYELNTNDYLEFNMHYMNHSSTIKRSIFIQRYIISLIFLVAPFLMKCISDIPFWYWSMCFIITYVLWIVFYPKHLTKSTKKRMDKLINEGKNLDLFGKHSLAIVEEGLIDHSEFGETKTNWQAIEKIHETEDFVYIYIGAVKAYIIPKRSFVDEAEKDNFLDEIKNKVVK